MRRNISIHLYFSESIDELQDFELPEAAINIQNEQGKIQPIGNFQNQIYMDQQLSFISQDVKHSQVDQIQEPEQVDEEEFILESQDGSSKQSSFVLSQPLESKISFGFQNQQEQSIGCSQQSGFKSHSILGFLSSQISSKSEI